MERQIIDLKGNLFKVDPRYKFISGIPSQDKDWELYNDKDRITSDSFILAYNIKSQKWYYISWIRHLNAYICLQLKLIRYEEKFDIRYEWKYRKELKDFYRKKSS